MDIVIDLSSINNFLSLPADEILKRIVFLFGWIPFCLVFLWGAKEIWLSYIRGKWASTLKYSLLAIDIPRSNEQSPKAVENLFAYLAGAHGSVNLIENYWEGKFQLSFSFEIVSIDGYTQFLIRTPSNFRNLVESAVYSQYPDAEITEVDDYTSEIPKKYPDEEYDIYGSEFVQKEHFAFPIKTYVDFEHNMGPSETQFKDPMATLMDLCSSLMAGEQLWYQIIIIPTGFDWPKEGETEIGKILGEKKKATFFNNMADKALEWIGDLSEAVYSLWGDIDTKKEETDNGFKMMNLKPKEKKQIEAIQEKISKVGFEFKARMVYVAKKEVMNKSKVANGFVGFMKQFATLDLNNLKPDVDITMTRASYLFKERRIIRKKNNIINNYINRDDWAGRKPGLLNIEELATIWHFPLSAVVKAPLIQKTPGKKSEPPMSLPVGEEIVSEDVIEPIFFNEKEDNNKNIEKKEKEVIPPKNLPIV